MSVTAVAGSCSSPVLRLGAIAVAAAELAPGARAGGRAHYSHPICYFAVFVAAHAQHQPTAASSCTLARGACFFHSLLHAPAATPAACAALCSGVTATPDVSRSIVCTEIMGSTGMCVSRFPRTAARSQAVRHKQWCYSNRR